MVAWKWLCATLSTRNTFRYGGEHVFPGWAGPKRGLAVFCVVGMQDYLQNEGTSGSGKGNRFNMLFRCSCLNSLRSTCTTKYGSRNTAPPSGSILKASFWLPSKEVWATAHQTPPRGSTGLQLEGGWRGTWPFTSRTSRAPRQ